MKSKNFISKKQKKEKSDKIVSKKFQRFINVCLYRSYRNIQFFSNISMFLFFKIGFYKNIPAFER